MIYNPDRRAALAGLGGLGGLAGTLAATTWLPSFAGAGEDNAKLQSPLICTQAYPWMTFDRREGIDFVAHGQRLMAAIKTAGIAGYEPIVESEEDAQHLKQRLKTFGLQMPSIYVNSKLHDSGTSTQSMTRVLGIAKALKPLNAGIIVTNPEPIRWGGDEDKTDAQLRHQAECLNRLGESLRQNGQTLAYHNHDAELRQGGREFHHMLAGTNPENVKWCLDAHWIYRGCGNSQVAVEDCVKTYASRIVELHLRQSDAGVWREDFRVRGDLDYGKLLGGLIEFAAQHKTAWGASKLPLLVLEQSVEDKSPRQFNATTAHQRGRENLEAWLNAADVSES
ncbi:MAG: sugar phosphate isomerase/epimerase [Planctomycetota bacterium]